MTYEQLCAAASEVGLTVRGGFHPEPEDNVPASDDDTVAATVVLIGNVGSSLWAAFAASPEFGDEAAHPMDRWTRRVVSPLSQRVGATAMYPFGGPPHHPFQRWAQRAEDVYPSPLGLLIHPEHGLWHAYRAALLFPERIELPEKSERASPCAACVERPCLSACPVGAFSGNSFDSASCARHIASPQGSRCMDAGCRARLGCPIGAAKAYAPDQQRFHMNAFLKARQTNVG